MAAKKFYAVKKGSVTGIFEDWEACKASVDGFPGAQYKGFRTMEEAEEYLGTYKTVVENCRGANAHITVYVDGSYDDSLKRYAFGCVFLHENGEIYTAFGNGDNPQSLPLRNVTGEMLGAMYAVKTAIVNGYEEVELCYDYEGIEKWVTGAWRAKNELTQKYAASMRTWRNQIRIIFTKVAAHTNVKYNEVADKTAKRGLTEGNGVPKIGKITELESYMKD